MNTSHITNLRHEGFFGVQHFENITTVLHTNRRTCRRKHALRGWRSKLEGMEIKAETEGADSSSACGRGSGEIFPHSNNEELITALGLSHLPLALSWRGNLRCLGRGTYGAFSVYSTPPPSCKVMMSPAYSYLICRNSRTS